MRKDEDKFKPLEVKARNNESPDSLVRRFLKKVKSDGVLKEHVNNRFYVKRSERSRMKKVNKTRLSTPRK